MKRSLYLECNSGISGDMTVAALLDLGADEKVLGEALDSLTVSGFQTEISHVKKAGIDCVDFNVILDTEHENHDHDMEFLHGHHHGEEHTHSHEHHPHEHHHHEEHHPHEHHHTHEHRGMDEITQIIESAKMTDRARKIATKIFSVIAQAESKAHNFPVNQVHFHEVGAVDSIVDIVAVAVCLDNLNVENVIVPKLCEGTGTVRCQHGILPVPVPAVANIIQMYGLNIQIIDVEGEFVTPTGAAIVAAIQTSDKLPKKFQINKSGLGAGKRNYERPSILRAMIIEEEDIESDKIFKLESNIDDCTGEALGFVMEQLFAAGARDVHYSPVYMKKNRPGWQLNVICKEENIEKLEEIIFLETTTIGIRKVEMKRSVLKREQMLVKTSIGEAQVKVCFVGDKVKYYPEYESVAGICKNAGISYMEAYHMILSACTSDNE